MENQLLQAPTLLAARQLYSNNSRITDAIDAALNEEEAYAADELVVLAEEILHQIAAVGFAHYIKHAPQKEVYNDFLVELFNSTDHSYNAGPIYRWAANMVKECPRMRSSGLFQFFWDTVGSGEVLAERVHHLAHLRNSVMHGFFVLPPERNRKEAEAIGTLLMALHEANVFETEYDFHFCRSYGFTGHWNIQQPEEWQQFAGNSLFGQLSAQILAEQQANYWDNEEQIFLQGNADLVPTELQDFISHSTNGSFACWVHPADTSASTRYASVGHWLRNQQGIRCIGYEIKEQGLSYSGAFLLARLLNVLNDQNVALPKNKRPEEQVKGLRKGCSDKVVVLINQIHIALFSPQHVSQLLNYLRDQSIILVALGYHYEHFNTYFNRSVTIPHANTLPDQPTQVRLLHNYLRFKGPSFEKADEQKDVELLQKILRHVVDTLGKGDRVFARRFADEHGYDGEFVHEIFALLHPWVTTTREAFEADTLHPDYGYPEIMTEVTPIYLALGRRDLKLEYQHKVLSA
jgi:hypothetical protein